MKNQETEQQQDILEEIVSSDYKYGFVSDIDQEIAPKGLNEDSIRLISSKKNEPLWMLEWRLAAFEKWKYMKEPKWPNVSYPDIDFNDISYYAAPKKKVAPSSLDEVDPE
ncbi:MAG: Fe-S cluster assembly protein SufB, partial [Bacteroidota bacterium]